jgi:hypothetical protein
MSTAELKIKLIKEITDSDNEDLLKDVYRLLEIENDDALPYIFTEEQSNMVNESLDEVKAGKLLSDEEANKRTDEWLEK